MLAFAVSGSAGVAAALVGAAVLQGTRLPMNRVALEATPEDVAS
jgi:hypothetical protein